MADAKTKYVIYRKSDRVVASIVYPRKTEAQTLRALAVELQNTLISELGGQAEDYGTSEFNGSVIPEGKKIAIDAAGEVMFIDNPLYVKKANDRVTAHAKLLSLGLTRDEILAISR